MNTSESSAVFHYSRTAAYAALFEHYGFSGDSLSHPCWQTDKHQLSCAKNKLETWEQLAELNRPSVISLITQDRRQAYALVIGINANNVILRDLNGKRSTHSLLDIGQQWNGDVYYLWRKPDAYDKPLLLGARSPVVNWVAEQFALLDGQSRAITDNLFTKRLQTRIKIFQSSEGLTPDGIIGEQTLMKLNEKLGLIATLELEE